MRLPGVLPLRPYPLLAQMELRELMFRRGLLSLAEQKQHRRIYPSVEGWGVSDVVSFLEQMGLGKYKAQFKALKVDGPTLITLGASQLASLLDVEPNEYEANERAL